MTTPLVSVIIIFYNASAYFEEAVSSVLAQTLQDFELLLVDDGSRDASTTIALGYAKRHPGRIRYLEHPFHANRGMSATRNLGIGEARGKFISFIDADDRWRSTKLADQVAIMERNPTLGAVCGTVLYWRSWAGGVDQAVATGHVQDRIVHPPEASLALYPLGVSAAPCPSDLMLRRAIVEQLGGFEEHFDGPRQMYEDQAFLAKLYLHAPIYFASSVWLEYRQHPGSIVAAVRRDGLYDDVRHYFLTWFETYLAQSEQDGIGRVRRACARALLPYRNPRVRAVLGATKLVRRTLYGAVGGLRKIARR